MRHGWARFLRYIASCTYFGAHSCAGSTIDELFPLVQLSGKRLFRPYTDRMDQQQAIQKARQFAETAHSVEVEKLVHKTQAQLAALRNRLAAQGTILSGTTVVETARIRGEQVTAMLE